MDPTRYSQWVSIHRKICEVDDGPVARGVPRRAAARACAARRFTVHWTLTECDPPNVGTWEGKGPAGSYARVTNKLSPNGNGGTHFEYENTFEAPGGAMGRLRLARGGRRRAEARGRQVAQGRSKTLLERR